MASIIIIKLYTFNQLEHPYSNNPLINCYFQFISFMYVVLFQLNNKIHHPITYYYYIYLMGCAQSFAIEGIQNLPRQLAHELYQKEQVKQKNNDSQENPYQIKQQSQQQFTSNKPWLVNLVAPSQKIQNNPQLPNKTLTLEFINGFNVQCTRQNIYWSNKPDTIIYPAAAVGISMNINTLKQKFIGAGNSKSVNGHSNYITSLAINPDRRLVLTGSDSQSLILLWDSDNMQIRGRIKLQKSSKSISTIKFSKNGKYFFCVDGHADSNVYCYQTATMKLKATSKCGPEPVINSDTGKYNTFACVNRHGIWFFQYNQKTELIKQKGIFGNNPITSMTSVVYSEKEFYLSGSVDGFIFYWGAIKCSKVRKNHEGSIMAITCDEDFIYSSGSQDKLLKVTNFDGLIISVYELPSYAKSIDVLKQNIIIGTRCGRILKLFQETKKQIIYGHSTGETWGLCVAPSGFIYTTADDNTILMIDPKTFKIVQSGIINITPSEKERIEKDDQAPTFSLLPINQQSRAIAVNQLGHVAIGINNGDLSIRTSSDLNKQIFHAQESQSWIQVIKYSPDSTKLAVGSHDFNIYIYQYSQSRYNLKGILKGHTSYIIQLDWSKDSNYLQSFCGAYDLFFWDIKTLGQIIGGATQFRNQRWNTYSIKIGWWVQGIFPPKSNPSQINCIDRSKDEKFIATGDNKINIFRNPCLKDNKKKSYKGHSGNVRRISFNSNDTYVYSIGGDDRCLMVWKIS